MLQPAAADIVMLGTFSAWRLGTLQARALPIAQELTRRGHSVAIVTTPWDQPTEAGVWDVIGGVRLINTTRASIPATPLVVREMVQITRSLRPRLVHVFKPRGFGGFAGLTLAGKLPLVVDLDDWEGDGGWNRIGRYAALTRRVFECQEVTLTRRASAITAASTLLASRARALRSNASPDTVTRVPNGLSDAWFEALTTETRHPVYCPAEPRILLYSRFEEIAEDWVARYVGHLRGEHPGPFRVVVVGPLPVCGRDLGCIDLLGYVARDELPGVLRSAAIAVAPIEDSLVSRSKQSVKLLELMAAGCPVVASDVGDVRATLGDAGLALDGADPRAFARSTARLLDDSELRSKMASAGPLRVERRFRIAVVTDAMEQAYLSSGAFGA